MVEFLDYFEFSNLIQDITCSKRVISGLGTAARDGK